MNVLRLTTTNSRERNWDSAEDIALHLGRFLDEALEEAASDQDPEFLPVAFVHTAAQGRAGLSYPAPRDPREGAHTAEALTILLKAMDTHAAGICQLGWFASAGLPPALAARVPDGRAGVQVAVIVAADRDGELVTRLGVVERAPGQHPKVDVWEQLSWTEVGGRDSLGPPQWRLP